MAEKEWDNEMRADLVKAYEAANPTPENTLEIVKQLAETFEKTANGVRLVLTKENVYVKKAAPISAAAAATGGGTAKRVNKTEAIADLKTAIQTVGQEVDADICDRLTGKAAVYFTGIIQAEK